MKVVEIKVNNQRKLSIYQCSQYENIQVDTIDSTGELESNYEISTGDFVTMLNWYRYQKSQGNTNLSFD